MNREEGTHTLLLIVMTLLFGLSFIASKNALQGLGVFQLIFGRYVFALFILTAVLWKKKKRFYIAQHDRKHFLLLTAIEPVGYFIFETLGIRNTTPGGVSLIIATIPVFSALFALWLLREKIGRVGLIGIIFSLAGVYLIVSAQRQSSLAPHPLLGSLFTFGAALAAGMYNVLSRRLSRRYSPLTITYYQTVIATLVFLPLALLELRWHPRPQLNGYILANVLYLSLGCSVIAYFILNYTLSRLRTARVAIFSNLIPVVTILASYFVYREFLYPLQLAGAALVVAGVYLTYRRG